MSTVRAADNSESEAVKVREAAPVEVAARCGLDPSRIAVALVLERAEGWLALGPEPFDSDVFGLTIGRILGASAPSVPAHLALLRELEPQAKELGYEQVLRRTPAANLTEVWALERAGFELMDVGVTFMRRVEGPVVAPNHADLVVRKATDGDIDRIVRSMAGIPWGSRFESDPAYRPEQVAELRRRWLWNSHRGRADLVLVGEMDSLVSGYITCVIDAGARTGDIELVGTLPAFRRRGVAARLLQHALSWLSTRVELINVRTQATNVAACRLYEQGGFTLHVSDLTLRLSLTDDPWEVA